MSFSSDVKKELANVVVSDCCLKAELYGILRYKSSIKISSKGLGVEICTTLNVVMRRIVFLLKKLYDCDIEIEAIKRQKLDYKTKYVLNVTKEALSILISLKILNEDYTINEIINYELLKKECCKSALFRGLFLVQGSINNPEADHYHLEITLQDETDVPYFNNVLNEVNIYPKYIWRTRGYILYLKKSEQIGDFLKYIGAFNCLFAFEDIRIRKDYNNSVNRVINCDIANEEKVLKSANEQLTNIKILTDCKGTMDISQRLLDAIVLRTTYPEYSLSELSSVSEETIGKYVSKSGLSHCFNDIAKLAKEIKKPK